MTDTFEQFISCICQDQTLFQSVEEAVRQGAILPILAYLGWNVYNIREVVPEFPVEQTRVDYCLKVGEKKAVFIEVKRVSEDLEKHERQLLEYSFKDGVDIAVLTNGLVWWFYLPLSGGSWQQRKFFTIDIQQQKPEDASQNFRKYLGRESVFNGSALQQARSLQASREKERLIKKTLPLAWDQLIRKPDERLIDLLSELVESMSGHRPSVATIKDFILGATSSQQIVLPESDITFIEKVTRKIEERSLLKNNEQSSRGRKTTKQQGVKVRINNQLISAESVNDLYHEVLVFLVQSDLIRNLERFLPYATSSRRYLIAKEPNHPGGNLFVRPVEYSGYYMESHKSYHTAINSLEKFLSLAGVTIEVIDSW